MAETPAYASRLLDAATAIGAKVEAARKELIGPQLNAEVLSEAISGRPVSRRGDDLPKLLACARIDGVPLLIGELTGPPVRPAIDAQLKRYRTQAMIARSWLAAEAANLQLFLLWQVPEDSDAQWRQLAASIEADERACRKLVWLFNGEPDMAAATRFLARTFAARPWPDASEQKQLDAMADFELPVGWEKAADSFRSDYDDLVNQLIALEGEGE